MPSDRGGARVAYNWSPTTLSTQQTKMPSDAAGIRVPVRDQYIEAAVGIVKRAIIKRTIQHGSASYASRHEVMCTLLEEWDELKEAVHLNDDGAMFNELVDVAVVPIFAIASALTVVDEEHSLTAVGQAAALESGGDQS